MEKDSKIYIAGHNGMVGSAILRNLHIHGYKNLIYRSYKELDLLRQADVEMFFKEEKPDYVFLAAARVGGIMANNLYRAQFIYENLMVQNNVIHTAHLYGVKKLLFLGSSCIYPKNAPQPLKEEYLLTSELEPTNEPYAIAKIAGLKMCESYFRQYNDNFLSVMPTNLYGPKDNYDLEKSHVLPALLRKLHLGKLLQNEDWEGIEKDFIKRSNKDFVFKSKDDIIKYLKDFGINLINNQISIEIWGNGSSYREFMYVEDMADACRFIMENINTEDIYKEYKTTYINIGSGQELTIKELVDLIKLIVDYKGEIKWDNTKPNGTPRKKVDSSLLSSLGWNSLISLNKGISKVYETEFIN